MSKKNAPSTEGDIFDDMDFIFEWLESSAYPPYTEESSVDLLSRLQEEAEAAKQRKQQRKEERKAKGSERRRRKLGSVATVLVIVFLVGLCSILGYYTWRLQTENASLSAENQALSQQVASYQKSTAEKDATIDALTAESNFWRAKVVLITPSGEKYHTYGCPHLEGRTPQPYLFQDALAKGYSPCVNCAPPLSGMDRLRRVAGLEPELSGMERLRRAAAFEREDK